MKTFENEHHDIIAPSYREQGFAYAFCCTVDYYSAVIDAANWCEDEFGEGEFELYNQWRIFLKTEIHAFQFKMRFC